MRDRSIAGQKTQEKADSGDCGCKDSWKPGEGPCGPAPCWAKDPEYKKLWENDLRLGKEVCKLVKKYKQAPEAQKESVKEELRKALR
ncbi:MAG: hypothetical protein IJM42_07280, partial [Synergistes sp.]|nr:hypothetical protein [Synergistes sp.]